MSVDLQQARLAAQRLADLEAARDKLPELEAEAKREALVADARRRALELETALAASLAAFRDQKAESDGEIADLLAHARRVVQRRLALSQQAAAIWQQARAWAAAIWQSENPGAALTPFQRHEVDDPAAQALVDAGYVNAQLLTMQPAVDGTGAAILRAVASLTGDVVGRFADPNDLRGRVLVREHDPATGEYRDVWQ